MATVHTPHHSNKQNETDADHWVETIALWLRIIGGLGKWLHISGLTIVIGFLLVMMIRAPYVEPTDYDYDEGINLMKSLLVNRGYPLYSGIWSDQPPIFTAVLATWMRVAGQTVAAARWLVILFASALLWSFYQLIRQTVSTFSATVATLLLVISSYYLRLSGSVMIGLPSIALAMSSLMLLHRSKYPLADRDARPPHADVTHVTKQGAGKPTVLRLLVSGALMALAVQSKLMAGFAIPGTLLYLLIIGQPSIWQRGRSVAVWMLSFSLIFLAIGLRYQSLHVGQLLDAHFADQIQNAPRFVASSATFWPYFYQHYLIYFGIAGIGFVWSCWHRRPDALLPAIWFLVALAALWQHRPLWYHHVLYLSVPLIWLSAYGVELWYRCVVDLQLTKPFHQRWQQGIIALLGFVTAAAVWLYPTPLPQRLADQMALGRPTTTPDVVAQLMADSTAQGTDAGWLFTDRPYYAFLADRAVPPEIAVFSRKRLSSGQLTDKQLAGILVRYQPEAILIERFSNELSPVLQSAVNQEYRLVLDMPPVRYYRRVP